jgi:hypothetical protein
VKPLPIVIEVLRVRGGWKASEGPSRTCINRIEPIFPKREHAINQARARASFRRGEIRIYDKDGAIERTVSFAPKIFPNRKNGRR